ncbi:MAG: cysteine hydrolase family protein [Comamonas sp.]
MSTAFLRSWLRLLALASAPAMAAHAAAAEAAPTPTIRAMSGATPATQLDARSTALLVIDFQNEYFSGRMPIAGGPAALARTQQLLAWADAAKLPVFQVQHVAPAGSALFALDGKTAQFHPGALPRPQDQVLQKTTVSVFASTDLDRRLKAAGIKTVVIAGLMTHACVAGAARDAAPLGYQVLVASDASATRSIVRADGSAVDQDSLHRAALAEIEDTFGDVMTTAQILALPLR